jgi:ABC-type sugar transport system ATPase subunit
MDGYSTLLEARNISKSFSGTKVLERVHLDVRHGEVHALVGENGAGKSTLMNILSGVLRPDEGEIWWEGRLIRLARPREAQLLGISFVHQELALAPQLSVAENIFLGRQPARYGFVNLREMHRRAREVLQQLQCQLDTRRALTALTLAERQLVEIARAVAFQCRLIIMDEPTAPLADHEREALFRSIRFLRTRGVSVIYISHHLREIFKISDRVTVLRDGKHVLTRPTSAATSDELVRAMIGGELKQYQQPPVTCITTEEVLRIAGAINLGLCRGEVVGLAGLAGAGRTELLEQLFGVRPTRSEVFLAGKPVELRTPMDAVRRGVALVPDDRKGKGLVLGASVRENVALAACRKHFFIKDVEEKLGVEQWLRSLRIKAAGWDQPVIYLSGGNQQKVVLAKWLLAGARVFLLDEPTRGIDVAAKAEVYEVIRMLAAGGAAVLMASSENEELMRVADRIIVMHRGRIAGEFTRAEATEEKILQLATGGQN